MAEESKEAIMDATYKALSRHGYADLSIQKIADEFDKGKSLIYYHYDDKEDLMLSFLDYMKEYIECQHQEISEEPAEKRLDKMLDMALGIEDDEDWEFRKALLEIRSQAPYNPKIAEKFKEFDELVMQNMVEITEQLSAENPEMKAEMLLSLITGTLNRKVTSKDREGLEELKANIKEIAEVHIKESCESG